MSVQQPTTRRPRTSTRWHFAFGAMLSLRRNPRSDCKSAKCTNRGHSYIPPIYIRVRAVVWECGEGQTDRHTQTRVTNTCINLASSTTTFRERRRPSTTHAKCSRKRSHVLSWKSLLTINTRYRENQKPGQWPLWVEKNATRPIKHLFTYLLTTPSNFGICWPIFKLISSSKCIMKSWLKISPRLERVDTIYCETRCNFTTRCGPGFTGRVCYSMFRRWFDHFRWHTRSSCSGDFDMLFWRTV